MTNVALYPGMPAIVIHGDADHVVAPVNADQLAEQFLRLNRIVDANGARKSGEVREERKGGVVMRDYVRGGRRVVRFVVCKVWHTHGVVATTPCRFIPPKARTRAPWCGNSSSINAERARVSIAETDATSGSCRRRGDIRATLRNEYWRNH